MKKLQPNLMSNANFFSRILFWWLNGFFETGSKRTLAETDLFELQPEDQSEELCARLEKNWNKELERREKSGKPRLIRAITKTFGAKLLVAGISAFAEEAVRTTMPVLIAGLVSYFENRDSTSKEYAYAYAAGISLCSVTIAIVHHQYFFMVQRIGWHLRASACALMYKKTLRLSQKSLNQTTTGQIVNLGATDVIRFDFLPMFLHYLWIGPLQCVVLAIILWREVGVATLAGFILLLLTMAMQTFNGRVFGKFRSLTAVLTDDRIRLMNEIISGIRIIKMYAWEKPFFKLVSEARRKEIRGILLSSAMKAINVSVFLCQEKAATFATLAAFVLLGGTITASKVFLVMGIYGTTKLPTGCFFALAVMALSESAASLTRIEGQLKIACIIKLSVIFGNYLLLDEFSSATRKQEEKRDGEPHIKFEYFTGMWNSGDKEKDKKRMTLSNLSVSVDTAQLLAVIGPVGAGKSSFLNAILGELPSISGGVDVKGEIVYANQTPWVFSGTIRENILFGEEFDPEWYKKVTSACCLKKDLSLFSEGDMTLVGERGVTLSGGQKARVNLARAAYRKRASIYLLDAPLSAVDPSVASQIFTQCIFGLMKDKVRVLVTHQLQLLKSADKIIILKEGKVVGKGTYYELQAKGTDFASLLQKRKEEDEAEGNANDYQPVQGLVKYPTHLLVRDTMARASSRSARSAMSFEEMPMEPNTDIEPEEVREQGSIGWQVYLEYFRVGSNAVLLGVFGLLCILSHVIYVMNDWWLAQWVLNHEAFIHSAKEQNVSAVNTSDAYFEASADGAFSTTRSFNSDLEEFDNRYYLHIYAALCVTMLAIILLRANMHLYICVTAGKHMHTKMFQAMLRAPVRFFDTNPVGRILNRFSKDMGQADELLPLTFMDFLFLCGLILSVVILVSIINYFVIIIVIPLVIYFVWLRRYYLRTSRDIKRLEGASRSPVFSLLSSTLQGLVTVRAFGVQDRFERRFHECQDLHSASWFLFLVGSRWFGVRLDLITSVFTSAAAFASVIAASLLNITSGEVGLILTYSASIIGLFQWGVRQSAEVENLMTSVERIQQYYRIPPEAPDKISDHEKHKEWPTKGHVLFQNVFFSYYEDGPLVLKDINLEIRPKEKIGLVGRTGAGKSSLISALFRLAELVSGEIYIDGVPISTIGLHDLRGALSIIPQDPILFTGTMRINLDPFDEYTDENLWDALEQVELQETVKSLPLQLNTALAESGSNFSVGQRQLVCLARAILRKSRILLIDEATANVDIRTDQLIQVTIREKFKQCTVITIAHRINTIIDSDRLLVLDAGRVKEFGEPHVLLQNKNGAFTEIVNCTGIAESATLMNAAKEAYEKKHGEEMQKIDDISKDDVHELTFAVPKPPSLHKYEIS